MLKKIIGQQFRQPCGLLGHFAARSMKKRNQPHYEKVIEILEIQDQDEVLEIGFGAGLAVKLITLQNQVCRIHGIDFSKLMLKKALNNNRTAVQHKQVEFSLGEFGGYDFGSKTYTKIFGINVIYFWEDLDPMFRKLYQLLRPGGRLVMYMSSPERLNRLSFAVDGVFNKHKLEDVLAKFKAAGFFKVQYQPVFKDGVENFYLCVER